MALAFVSLILSEEVVLEIRRREPSLLFEANPIQSQDVERHLHRH